MDGEQATASQTGSRRWIGLGVLAAGLSMIILDGTIVGVALPRIMADLDLSLTEAQWVNSLYAMVFAALLLTFGRLGDRLGRRRVFLAGVVIFVGGSIAAAMSLSASSLITARAVQGVGGAAVLPATLSTVNATFRGKDRATAFGVWGAVMAGMAAVGPLLGGWLTTSFSWPWIFLVNVPIGVAILAMALFFVDETRGNVTGKGADVDGLLTSAIGFGLLVFGVIEGPRLGWWTPIADFHVLGIHWPATAPISAPAVALMVGATFVGLFLLWEGHRARVGRSALLDLTIFRFATFSWGNLTAMMVAIGEFALVFVLPLYLVNGLGLTVMGAGFVLAAMAIGAFIAGAQARHLSARLGPPRVVILGLVLEILGAGATAFVIGPSSSPWLIAGCMTVYGIGLGLAAAQLTSTILADVPPGQSGSASATQSTVRQLGAALGSALAGTVLAVRLSSTLQDALAGISGLPSGAAARLADMTSSSAGGNLIGLRAQGTTGQLGELGPRVVDTLTSGFATATAWAVGAAVAFLLLGLLGAGRVARAARVTQTSGQAGQADPASLSERP
ncbi:MAG: DHA2 family efflux MFS transporter permease subunit [Micrococcales bacterium]|nr:DHA2 family efflux MFS transporter permease subunit [Micrococcales bacterium]